MGQDAADGDDSGGGSRDGDWPGALDEHRPATESDRRAVPATQQLSATLVRALGLDGAAVAMIGDTGERNLVHAADPVIAHLDELQFTLAEGPCLDAYGAAVPVLVDDLRDESSRARCRRSRSPWPPAVCFGVLELYRHTPGPLDGRALQTVSTGVAALTKVALTELLGPESDPASSWPARLTVEHAEVHQAAGMVAVHLGKRAWPTRWPGCASPPAPRAPASLSSRTACSPVRPAWTRTPPHEHLPGRARADVYALILQLPRPSQRWAQALLNPQAATERDVVCTRPWA